MFRKFAYIIQKNLNLKRDFNDNKDITKEELDIYIKEGATIIDVRSPQEYKEGHVNGAISIPDYQIKKDIQKYIKEKDELIVVYCSTGHRSQNAQKILESLGYTNVYNVYEGIIIWDKLRLPLLSHFFNSLQGNLICPLVSLSYIC